VGKVHMGSGTMVMPGSKNTAGHRWGMGGVGLEASQRPAQPISGSLQPSAHVPKETAHIRVKHPGKHNQVTSNDKQ
jgi:hypothetical protein